MRNSLPLPRVTQSPSHRIQATRQARLLFPSEFPPGLQRITFHRSTMETASNEQRGPMRKAAKRLRESPVTPLTTRIPPTGKKKDRVFCCEAVEPYLTNLESIASGRRLHSITNTRNLRNRGAALNMLKINDFRMPPSREHKNCFSVGMWRSSVWLTKRGSLLLAL